MGPRERLNLGIAVFSSIAIATFYTDDFIVGALLGIAPGLFVATGSFFILRQWIGADRLNQSRLKGVSALGKLYQTISLICGIVLAFIFAGYFRGIQDRESLLYGFLLVGFLILNHLFDLFAPSEATHARKTY
jgi:hypothetical protein